jgi:hypothetical protein
MHVSTEFQIKMPKNKVHLFPHFSYYRPCHGASYHTGRDRLIDSTLNCVCAWRDEAPRPCMTEPRTVCNARVRRTDSSRCVWFVGSRPVKVEDVGRQLLCESSFTFQPFEFF